MIGSESHGVQIKDFFLNQKIILPTIKILFVRIPIELESLNCSISFAIIGFEIKKILHKIKNH